MSKKQFALRKGSSQTIGPVDPNKVTNKADYLWFDTASKCNEAAANGENLTKEQIKFLERKARIEKLKSKLLETDYITLPDYDKDKPDVIEQRQQWREEIRALENDLK